MRYIYSIILLSFIVSCKTSPRDFDESNLDDFQNATKVIISKYNSIIIAGEGEYHYPTHIFSGNKFAFEIMAKKASPELEELIELWNDGFIMNDKTSGFLTIRKDSSIIFTIDNTDGSFKGQWGLLIYDPHNNNAGIGDINSKIISSKDFGNNFKYIIEERYYVD